MQRLRDYPLAAVLLLPALVGGAYAAYPDVLVYPQQDGSYVYRVTMHNEPAADNFYVREFGINVSVLMGTPLGPEGWTASYDSGAWGTFEERYMIRPDESLGGFALRSMAFVAENTYSAYGWDPVARKPTKWWGIYTSELVPEPAWLSLAVVAVLAFRTRRWRR